MDPYIIFWLIATIVFVVVELITVGLTSIWFAAGSLGALAVAAFGGNVIIQAIVFLIVSVVLLVLTKPWAQKYINAKAQKTNVDVLIGQKAILTEDVDNLKQTGKATVNGQEWTVRSFEDQTAFKAGELIEIVEISGVKLIVKKAKED